MASPVNPNKSDLDFQQIIQRSFDEVNDRLRTDAVINTSMGDVEVELSHTEDSVAIGDGTDLLAINPDGSINTSLSGPATYAIANISMALADTEYSFNLPDTARKFRMKLRENKGPLRIYETSGGSDYYTISRGSSYEEDLINPNSLTFYVQTAQDNCVLELIYWEI